MSNKMNLNKAVKSLKNVPIPAGPSQQVIDALVWKMNHTADRTVLESTLRQIRIGEMIGTFSYLAKAVAAVIVIAVSIVFTTTYISQKPAPVIVKQIESQKAAPKEIVKTPTEKLEIELQKTKELFAAKNVNGLVAMLSKAEFAETKVIAAGFLEQIGDRRALAVLEKLDAELGGGDPNNPFAKAIRAILNREREPNKPINENPVNKGAAQIPATDHKAKIFNIYVVDKNDGQPISGVNIKVKTDADSRKFVTDANGCCKVAFDKNKPNYVTVKINKKGYVPIQLDYNQDRINFMPESYTAALETGTSIGGIVRNENNNAVEGAQVKLTVQSGNEIERVDITNYAVKTDANGFWRCDIMPSKLDNVGIKISHPDYINDEAYNENVTPAIEKLRDMTAEIIIRKGVTITGIVTDLQSKGISMAKISNRSGELNVISDVNGIFKFMQVRPGKVTLLAQAKGYGPQAKELTINWQTAPVEFRLEPGHTIRGRIIDVKGKAVKGAFVVPTDSTEEMAHISLETDANGCFEWKEAPSGDMSFDILKAGLTSIRNFVMNSKNDYIITMYPLLRVSGQVRDAETGQLIDAFRLVPGTVEENNSIDWMFHMAIEYKQGRYETAIDGLYSTHAIRIESAGYLPAVSRLPADKNEDLVIDITMKKSVGITGTVFLPDCKPAEDAQVVLCFQSDYVSVRNGRLGEYNTRQSTKTASDGSFSFNAQTEDFMVLAIHDKGCAQISKSDFAANPNIILKSWGRLEGTIHIDDEAGANQQIKISYRNPSNGPPRIWYDYQTIADVNGHFVFEKLLPGLVQVCRAVESEDKAVTLSHPMAVEVLADETAKVTMDCSGLTVTGIAKGSDNCPENINWSYASYNLMYIPQLTEVQQAMKMAPQDRQAWYRQWANSEQGKAALTEQWKQTRFYAGKMEEDGSFSFPYVPAGTYRLIIDAYPLPRNKPNPANKLLGRIDYKFEIPDSAVQNGDEQFDIGVLEMKCIDYSKR